MTVRSWRTFEADFGIVDAIGFLETLTTLSRPSGDGVSALPMDAG
jgi:hypothetical protein